MLSFGLLLPVLLLNVPGGASLQILELVVSAYEPGGHLVGKVLPGRSVKVPIGLGRQKRELLAPTVADEVPGGQGEHTDEPTNAKNPGAHVTHEEIELDPMLGFAEPAEQILQEVWAVASWY